MFLPTIGIVNSFQYGCNVEIVKKVAPALTIDTDRVALSIAANGTHEYKYTVQLRWYRSKKTAITFYDVTHLLTGPILLYQPVNITTENILAQGYIIGFDPRAQQIQMHDLENHNDTIQRPKDLVIEITGADLLPYRTVDGLTPVPLSYLRRFSAQ